MNLGKQQLIGLPAFTQSNQSLGRVCDFELDSETQKIIRYHLKSERTIRGLLARELIIASEQVISIDREKMVVEDNVVKEKSQAFEPTAIAV